MLSVHVLYHKDGDHLEISENPWWSDIYIWILEKFCPCCGVRGWILDKAPEKVFSFAYNFWNKLYFVTDKYEKVLYRVPIENGCVVAKALWPTQHHTCFRDDCENC